MKNRSLSGGYIYCCSRRTDPFRRPNRLHRTRNRPLMAETAPAGWKRGREYNVTRLIGHIPLVRGWNRCLQCSLTYSAPNEQDSRTRSGYMEHAVNVLRTPCEAPAKLAASDRQPTRSPIPWNTSLKTIAGQVTGNQPSAHPSADAARTHRIIIEIIHTWR